MLTPLLVMHTIELRFLSLLNQQLLQNRKNVEQILRKELLELNQLQRLLKVVKNLHIQIPSVQHNKLSLKQEKLKLAMLSLQKVLYTIEFLFPLLLNLLQLMKGIQFDLQNQSVPMY